MAAATPLLSGIELPDVAAHGDEGDPSRRSVVQFATHLMYTAESEEKQPITVMRIGCLGTSCSVTYRTRIDQFSGIKYDTIKRTKLEFGPGESTKIVYLQVRDTSSYDCVVDVELVLDDPDNCTLGKVRNSRVKIVDNDVFPDNTFLDEILEDHTSNTWREGRDFTMFMAFAKVAFKLTQPGSWYIILSDQLDNMIYISQLAINKAIITTLTHSLDNTCEFTVTWRRLLTYAMGLTLPVLVTHYLDYRRQFWKVSGGARKLLLNGLLQKFLYYQGSLRDLVDISEFKLVYCEDTFALIDRGFMQFFVLVGHIGRIAMVILFTVVLAYNEYTDTGDEQVFLILAPMIAVPPLMIWFVRKRQARSEELREDVLEGKITLVHHMNNCVERASMILAYFARPLVMRQCHDRIQLLNQRIVKEGARRANDLAFFNYVANVVEFLVVFFGGLSVAHGDTNLGSFTAALSALKGFTALLRSVYSCMMQIQASYPSLWHVVEYMNHPTDLSRRQKLEHGKSVEFKARLQRLLEQPLPSEGQPVDRMDITLESVHFSYPGSSREVIKNMSMSIRQGRLVAITGPPAVGFKTLTSLLASELLPDSGTVFVPPYLRVLRVAIQPVLWDGPLAMSVFFGLLGDERDIRIDDLKKLGSAEVERGLRICRRLNIPEHLLQLIREDVCGTAKKALQPSGTTGSLIRSMRVSDVAFHRISSSISASARAKIQLACALISDPPVLVLDRPLQALTIDDAFGVMECLREYVENRGLEKSRAHRHGRRPRTCIITSNSPTLMAGADEVFTIGDDGSLQPREDVGSLAHETEQLVHDREEAILSAKSRRPSKPSRVNAAGASPATRSFSFRRPETGAAVSPRASSDATAPPDRAPSRAHEPPTI